MTTDTQDTEERDATGAILSIDVWFDGHYDQEWSTALYENVTHPDAKPWVTGWLANLDEAASAELIQCNDYRREDSRREPMGDCRIEVVYATLTAMRDSMPGMDTGEDIGAGRVKVAGYATREKVSDAR